MVWYLVLYNCGVARGLRDAVVQKRQERCASQKGFARHLGYTDLEPRCLNLPPKMDGCIYDGLFVFSIFFPETTKAWNPWWPELKPGPTIASANGIMALLGIPTAGPLAGALQGIPWW